MRQTVAKALRSSVAAGTFGRNHPAARQQNFERIAKAAWNRTPRPQRHALLEKLRMSAETLRKRRPEVTQ